LHSLCQFAISIKNKGVKRLAGGDDADDGVFWCVRGGFRTTVNPAPMGWAAT
jgi:hypothetical protein